ncbi:sensor histidine kinase [Actinomadura rupiterrae]|uniref:sensor histidine kinase n=1 Tax=Actinomadura rupiterrae TaxID=559627 RepID=UPI0020A5BA02|nr:histidine kinase [Actinomadura rupiterrae]MCP2336760.1 signal transduction histidine kinase [Actinomadura rupiterrae]
MRPVVSWVREACAGSARAGAVAALGLPVPILWAGIAAGIWFLGNPWAWTAPIVLTLVATLLTSRGLCAMFRKLVAQWTGTVIPGGHWEARPVTRMSTGYWWNGYSYSRSNKEAAEDQRLRILWHDPATWRDLRFVPIAALAGLVAAVPFAGFVTAVVGFGVVSPLLGVAGLVVAVGSAPYAWRATPPLTVRFLRPSRAMLLAGRVDELTAQRADTTVAQAAEIRRIERDLHDGAQARLVSLGLALATAEKLMETNPEAAKALMREARAGAASSLTEIRDLVRGINPPVLTERGLVDAVRALALDTPLDVTVSADALPRLDAPIESAVYFGVAELLTNAVKHARAHEARVSIVLDGAVLVVEVEDDGRGGADPGPGGGLDGLRRRLAVFDGSLEVTSPEGGPTRARMAVPCGS